MSKSFWRGFCQGTTWWYSWPLAWLFLGIGHVAWLVVDRTWPAYSEDETPRPWWWEASYVAYQRSMNASVFFNDLGGLNVWKSVSTPETVKADSDAV